MCGIVGIIGSTLVNQSIYDALTVLQHRGQDAAGIVTIESNRFRLRKANGLVSDVFAVKHMLRLQGTIGIGHVRYPTAGSSSASEAQPFYVNSPYGITLAHNGNITNASALREELFNRDRRHVNTTSDSEVLLNVFAQEIDQVTEHKELDEKAIFEAITAVHNKVSGAYAVVAMIIGHGLLGFRDPNGIRPLCIGKRTLENGKVEYMLASESVALDAVGFDFMRDVAPGECIYIKENGDLFTQQCAKTPRLRPCLFEYVYFARPDSFLDKISVYGARVHMGRYLGKKILREWSDLDIDVVIPIPETSCDIALQIAQILNKPYRQGYVKNRYVGRTFIMPGQAERKKSVRRKLNAIRSEFKDKNVLLVDDSIVRGTTSSQIIDMAREAGAKNVYFASAAPEIRFPNVYGIDMPSANELIAHGRDVEEINHLIGSDKLIYQSLDDLISAVKLGNPEIEGFETSVFSGEYITEGVDQNYLSYLESLRSDDSKKVKEEQLDLEDLELYNEGN